MEHALSNIISGSLALLDPTILLLIFAGTVFGVVIGALPGLTSTMGVALLVPITFGMSPAAGLALLGAIYCSSTYSGAISAILSVFPEESCMMWKYAGEGKHDEGIRLQNSLYKKWQSLGGNQFPIRMKYALKLLGRDTGYCRSPITYLPEEDKKRIRESFLA